MTKYNYPKPVSKRELKKRYEILAIQTDHRLDINLPKGKERIDKIHFYLQCFSNLYGSIDIYETWNVLQHYESNHKLFDDLKLEDYLLFTDVLKVEDLPYSIYELTDIFAGEYSKAKEDRILVNKNLIHLRAQSPNLRFFNVYLLLNYRNPKGLSPYLPSEQDLDDFYPLDWYESTKEYMNLKHFLGRLKVISNSTLKDYYDEPIANKRLKNVIYVKDFEKKYIQSFKQEWRRKQEMELYVRPFPDLMMDDIKRECLEPSLFPDRPTYSIDKIFEALDSVETVLDESNVNSLLQLYMSLNNKVNSWSLFGWAPFVLAKEEYKPTQKTAITFGPNMKKQFASGELNKEEYIDAINKLGIDVIDDDDIDEQIKKLS